MEKRRPAEDEAKLHLRLKGAPAVRFNRVLEIAQARNPYASISDVIKELLGIVPPTALTKEEIEYFRTGKKK